MLFVLLCGMQPRGVASEPIDFNRDVRPILAEKCFHCHGPDEAARQADLRLDRKAAVEESGVVVPGKPDESPLIQRITATDPDERMPPADAKISLTPEQQKILHTWVEQGGGMAGTLVAHTARTTTAPPTCSCGRKPEPDRSFYLYAARSRGPRTVAHRITRTVAPPRIA